MYQTNPLEVLHARLMLLGKVLSALCCLWIAVVGTILVRDLTPNDLEHHRSPVIQDRVNQCEGSFSRRYACADTILLNGEHRGAREVLLRLGVTLILPTVAWVMWHAVLLRAERLRNALRRAALMAAANAAAGDTATRDKHSPGAPPAP